MAGERRQRILSRFRDGASDWSTKRLCEVCAEVTEMTGAGIMLMDGSAPRGSICSTDAVSTTVEDVQFELGEGPCIDAFHLEHPVLEPDLVKDGGPRWPGFSPPAITAGVRAIFGFPMQVGATRIGALNLYRDQPGPITDDQHADALVMADVAAQSVLLLQAGAPAGVLAAELEAGGDFKVLVHQATGMVAAQLNVAVGQALVRLRAHAFGNGRGLTDIARDVVERRLRFDTDTDNFDPAE